MEWSRPAEALAFLLEGISKGMPCTKRSMFACPCYFAGDRMFAGVYDDGIFLRVPADDRPRLEADWPGLRPFEPMPGRVMKEYVLLPAALVASPAPLSIEFRRSFDHAAALPPKAPKDGKRRRRAP